MTFTLTKQQQAVLDFICQYMDKNSRPPTRVEITRAFGFRSTNAAQDHLKVLEKQQRIELISGVSRGIRVLDVYRKKTDLGLPIIGRVAAGAPILAHEHIEDYCRLPTEFFHPSADFLLEVKGQSMQNIGIVEGDLVAVHKTTVAENGQIVVARVYEDVTLKRYYKKGNQVRLEPENDAYQTLEITLGKDSFCIEGLYVGLIRRH
jgi:repressor LexA